MRQTSTGAVLRFSNAPNRSRNMNTLAHTATPAPIASNSGTPHATPTLIQSPSTKARDYLFIVALILALLILVREG